MIICKFCNIEVILPQLNYYGTCAVCDTLYEFYIDEFAEPQAVKYTMSTDYKGSRYYADFYMWENYFRLTVRTHVGPSGEVEFVKEVVKMNCHPNITPFNFKDKLPILLTFL